MCINKLKYTPQHLKFTAVGVGGVNGARVVPRVESASVDVTARATAPGHLQMAITALGTV